MFERFTEKAIKVIMLAQEEARRLGHNFVGTEQILLGLIGEGTGVAAKVLKSINLKSSKLTCSPRINLIAINVTEALTYRLIPQPNNPKTFKFSISKVSALTSNTF